MIKYFPFLLLLFALWSCGPSYEYEKELVLADGFWSYQDSLVADFVIEDTSAIYNLHLILEHGDHFPYQNFYVRLHTRFPGGEVLSEQLSLEIAGRGGVWLGDCSSQQCVLDIPIQQGAYFGQAGKYQLSVAQFSRKELLEGVNKLTFQLEKTDQAR